MLRLGVFCLTIAILAACGVYSLKHRVQGLERDLARVERMVEEEKIQIRRLRAEWATLSRPERLARLTEAHLELQPARPGQIVSIADIPLREDLRQDQAPALVSSVGPAAGKRFANAGEAIAQ
jgi:cell division protein FtsL